MFGAFNYRFRFSGVTFVMFDNVIWESNKSADYEWLASALSEADDVPIRHKIVFSHIPPFDGQLADKKQQFHSMLLQNNVNLSVHGHRHTYYNDHYFEDQIRYVTVGSPQYRSYAILTITQDQIVVEQIPY
jgi:Icc protein